MSKDFLNQYDARVRERSYFSPSGSSLKPVYRSQYNRDGELVLVASGEEDLQAYIQSHAESVDINVILTRFANGDSAALSKVQGAFGDVTGMPKSYAEMLNSVIAAQDTFDRLPRDVRQSYDNSWTKWLSQSFSFAPVDNVVVSPVDPVDPHVAVKEVVFSES